MTPTMHPECISRSELFDAVEDYFNRDLNRSDLFDVIEAYFG